MQSLLKKLKFNIMWLLYEKEIPLVCVRAVIPEKLKKLNQVVFWLARVFLFVFLT